MLLDILLLFSQQPIAVLESGTRIETIGSVKVGQRHLETPFGRFDASLDPVASMSDSGEDLRLLAPLKELDYGAWLQSISDRGMLTLLLQQEVDEGFQVRHQQLIEDWGSRLDTLPSRLARDERVEELWKRLLKAGDEEQLLLTGALMREISEASQAVKRRVGLSSLGKALKSKDAETRRAAARVAQRQVETGLSHKLMKLSLEEPQESARRAISDAAYAIDPQHSLGRWTVALWRSGPEQERIHAAGYLGDYGADEAGVVKALIIALGAESSAMAPRSYVFFGRQIAAVTDFDVEVANSAFIADPVVTTLTEGVALEVRVVSVHLGRAIRNSLTRLTGANPGPKRTDWANWFEQQGT
ncbi:MAG: hypothetical protein ACYSU1_06010 [Planctomycetota bacterium]|jgi:chorismate-pyruvate lyase